MRRIRLACTVTALTTVTGTVVGTASCPDAPPPAPPAGGWAPGTIFPAEGPVSRDFVDVRGLVHAHSVFSHDACDGEAIDENGVIDSVCFDDFRRGLCQSQHDFVFLTDHGDRFDTTEYPDTLLFKPDLGDVLVNDGSANRITCDDGHTALIMAGSENNMMPVGLEHHIPDRSLYGSQSQETADALHDAGAVILLAHPEDYDTAQLIAMPVDGFEMYNLHANTLLGAGFALDLLVRANDGDPGVPHPDLLVLALWSEDPAYMQRWGNVLASGKKIVSTMGTDCHRNTFRTILEDGERADSYRRMMISFSNHLRIKPGDNGIDDADLKEALAAGRLWGAFENMGYPVGFDAVADKDGTSFEFGGDVPVGATIRATMPTVRDLDPAKEAPSLRLRLMKADASAAGFVEVASSDADLSFVTTEPGAYRVEVRMLPLHLRQDLRDEDFRLLDELEGNSEGDYVWIYANPFYVR
jgi:hypothetical protein